MFIKSAVSLQDLLKLATAVDPFTVTTEALGEVQGRQITGGHLTRLLASKSRDPEDLFRAYLPFLWKAGQSADIEIGPDAASQLTDCDRATVARAYMKRYLPQMELGDTPAPAVVGQHFKEQAESLDRSVKALNETFFTADTKALFHKSWDSSEQIKELLAELNRPVKVDVVRQMEAHARAERDAIKEAALKPIDASLGVTLDAARLRATATAERSMHSIASSGLQRINDVANVIEAATADLATHRQATTNQFKLQLWVAVAALLASVVLGIISNISDSSMGTALGAYLTGAKERESARLEEVRAHQEHEKALLDEIRQLRQADQARMEALLKEVRDARARQSQLPATAVKSSKQSNR